ncbi:GntR family transcriptional regulator [Azospirillum sp. ST 5-10]|uniref:GntR family transcriptional regulator n=1 Tax=unclassified Azospirillum TaxID=2630922 RepID=UPI003F49CD99
MPSSANKTDRAYDRIVRMITFQELKPGSMVSEGTLMDVTGLGRTPVREALQRLALERMVEIHPRRGIVIPPVSVEVQLKLLELRRAVEELAVRMATHRATAEQRRAMLGLAADLERLEDTDDIHAFGELLKAIHDSVGAAAQNEYLQLAMMPLQGLSRRFWFANLKDRRAELRSGARLHAATLRAVACGDEAAAAAASLALNDYLTDFAYRTLRRGDAPAPSAALAPTA